MAYRPKIPSDGEVFAEDRTHVRFFLENLSELFESQYLEVAEDLEEKADEEDYRSPVEPRDKLQSAQNNVAHVEVAVMWNVTAS